MEEYVPDRGDIVWISFHPQAGHEQAGRRPAVVLSPRAYNTRVGLAIFVPVTSRAKGYTFEVPLPDLESVTGVALVDQVKSFDWRARRVEFIAQLPTTTVNGMLERLVVLLEG